MQQAVRLVGARVDRHARAQVVVAELGEDDVQRLHRGAAGHVVQGFQAAAGAKHPARGIARRSQCLDTGIVTCAGQPLRWLFIVAGFIAVLPALTPNQLKQGLV